MAARSGNRTAVLQWVVVLVVGVLVVAIVLALKLIPRLSAGQKVLTGARPAFATGRVAGDRAGVNFVSTDVNVANPIVTAQGGGAGEVPALVAYAAKAEHATPAATLALLQKDFPHTTALLEAVPLSSVTAELPGLVAFLGKTLHLSTPQVLAALKANFPHLTQAITNLPTVTNGWYHIPNIGGLTRFDGTPVQTAPQLRTYLSSDLVPVLENQGGNFGSLDGTSSVDWIAPLLLIVGVIVILFAIVMIFRTRKGVSRTEGIVTAAVVPIVGVVVVALVLILSLIPRVSNGQKLLDALKPVNTQARVAGDRAGINFISTIVNLEDPIMTSSGGASAEVPKLIAFVSQKTGLAPSAVVAVLQKNFPHTTALLQALPLSAVSKELPGVVATLGPPVVNVVPKLLPTVLDAPALTGGWSNVPGTAGLTSFNGTPIHTAPQVRDYFSNDVIPVLETQRANYEKLVATSKIDFIGPLVLIIGIIVIIFGLLMVYLAMRVEPTRRTASSRATAAPRTG